MTTLEHEFQRIYDAHIHPELLHGSLHAFYQEKSIDVVTVENLISQLFANFETFSFATTLQNFVAITLMATLEDSLQLRILQRSYQQLVQAKPSRRNFYIHGLFYFLEQILQLPSTTFSLIDWTHYSREISAEKTIILCSLWVLLGKKFHQKNWIQQGITLLESQKRLLDHNHHPFLSFGEKDHSYDKEKNLLAFALMFAISSKLHPEISEHFFESLRNVQKVSHPLIFVLFKKIDQLTFEENICTSLMQCKWAKFSKGQISGLVSFDGIASSLAFFKFQQIEIPALGPQSLPLHETKDFGITSSSGCYKYDGKNHVIGWLQWNFNRSWWLIDVQLVSDTIDLQLRSQSDKLDDPFAFVFFIKAKQCNIQQDVTLLPGSLEHYSGSHREIVFQTDNEAITIHSTVEVPTQVIPLAGEGCFWGGDFMLAYDIHSPSISFKIHHNLFFNT